MGASAAQGDLTAARGATTPRRACSGAGPGEISPRMAVACDSAAHPFEHRPAGLCALATMSREWSGLVKGDDREPPSLEGPARERLDPVGSHGREPRDPLLVGKVRTSLDERRRENGGPPFVRGVQTGFRGREIAPRALHLLRAPGLPPDAVQ